MAFGDGPRWIEVAPPGSTVRITLPLLQGAEADGKVGGFTGFVFATDDVNATYQDLVAQGVEFTQAPTQQPWGKTRAQFVDQDGNQFVLVGPK